MNEERREVEEQQACTAPCRNNPRCALFRRDGRDGDVNEVEGREGVIRRPRIQRRSVSVRVSTIRMV
jgi:hypothetical protein